MHHFYTPVWELFTLKSSGSKRKLTPTHPRFIGGGGAKNNWPVATPGSIVISGIKRQLKYITTIHGRKVVYSQPVAIATVSIMKGLEGMLVSLGILPII